SDHLASSTTSLAELLDGRIANLTKTVSGSLGKIEDFSGLIAGSVSSRGKHPLASRNATTPALSGSTHGRLEELNTTAERFAQRINPAGGAAALTINESGEQLLTRLTSSSSNLAELLDSRIADIGDNADTFLARLDAAASDLSRSFQDRT